MKILPKAITLPTCLRGIYPMLPPSTRPYGTTMTTQRLVSVRVYPNTIEMRRCAPFLVPHPAQEGIATWVICSMPGERLVHRGGGLLVIMLPRGAFLKDGTIIAPTNSHHLCVAHCRVGRQRIMIPAVALMPGSSHHHGSMPGRSSLPRRVIAFATAAPNSVERCESLLYDVVC